MTKQLILGILILSSAACTEMEVSLDKTSPKSVTEKNPLDGYVPVNIELTVDMLELMIPSENLPGNEAEIFTTNSGVTNVIIGNKFHLEILESDMLIDHVKSDLKNDIFYKNKVIKEKDDLMIYEKELPDHSKKFVHFFMTKKINNQTISIRSGSNGEFKRSHIDRMMKSANTIKPSQELASSVQ